MAKKKVEFNFSDINAELANINPLGSVMENSDFSEVVRKQYTIAKFAYHNFILAYISNSIGVIIPILVKKAN